MGRDFTYRIYEDLIESILANEYRMLTVREYLSREELPERFVMIRHDIDRKPENALDFARLEAEAEAATSYYFRAIRKTFKPDLLEEIETLGHEVGYHYEDLDSSRGDVRSARASFAENLDRFREVVNVDTVSMHGNPLTSYDNRDIWTAVDFEEFGLLGEVYLSVDFSDVIYFSDTNRTWLDAKTIVNDWPLGDSWKPVQIRSTPDLIDLVESRELPRIYLLVHPNRWADSTVEWVAEYTKDVLTNVGKWGLWKARSVRRRERIDLPDE